MPISCTNGWCFKDQQGCCIMYEVQLVHRWFIICFAKGMRFTPHEKKEREPFPSSSACVLRQITFCGLIFPAEGLCRHWDCDPYGSIYHCLSSSTDSEQRRDFYFWRKDEETFGLSAALHSLFFSFPKTFLHIFQHAVLLQLYYIISNRA